MQDAQVIERIEAKYCLLEPELDERLTATVGGSGGL